MPTRKEGTGRAILVLGTCQTLPPSLHTQLGSVLQSKDEQRFSSFGGHGHHPRDGRAASGLPRQGF